MLVAGSEHLPAAAYAVAFAAAFAIIPALILGLMANDWLADPLRGPVPEAGRQLSDRRQQTVCVIAALLCYYVPGLVVVHAHASWAGILPYLRAHLFDGFGCAALFGLAFGRLRAPMPAAWPGQRTYARADRIAMLADRRVGVAALQLTGSSALIAACAAWVAGGGPVAIIAAAVWPAIPLQAFWSLVVIGVGSAPALTAGSSQDQHGPADSGV